MNTFLVLLICVGGNWCTDTPQYVIKYETESQCSLAKDALQRKSIYNKVYCVPEIKTSTPKNG